MMTRDEVARLRERLSRLTGYFGQRRAENNGVWSIGLGWASLYLSLAGVRGYGAVPRCTYGRDYGVYLADGWFLCLMWGHDHIAWEKTEAGWSKSWFVKDVLLGRAVHSEVKDAPVLSLVQMPEGAYPCTVTLSWATWKRPRWPWATRLRVAEVEMDKPVPVPGKGENSWDCDEDGIYSSHNPGTTVEEAVANVAASAHRTRERYGGRQLRPAKSPGAAPERREP